ncbi:MAG TPA: UDP-glucose 4-epimerase GalE [Candidatus Polarisedimenticolaceae bacterium]
MSDVLVVGGAGYVGSHVVRRLVEAGREVVALDDLSMGHRLAVGGVPFVEGNFGDAARLAGVLGGGGARWIVHLAASALVGESVADPAKYYANNLVNTLTLLDAARRHDVEGIVFSSTAAVYGDPVEVPIVEQHPCAPTNPYGETKLAIERALGWYHRAYGLKYVALRYFNAAGAHPSGEIGEDHDPETHLIPRLIGATLQGGPTVPIFGEDYPTSDGTCVRDYVHVVDLAEAHVRALDALERGAVEAEAFNLGNGEGFSVREVVDTVARISGRRPPVERAPRRAGDPAILVASSEKARRRLGWEPRFASLESIVRTAWDWHLARPGGYGDRRS